MILVKGVKPLDIGTEFKKININIEELDISIYRLGDYAKITLTNTKANTKAIKKLKDLGFSEAV